MERESRAERWAKVYRRQRRRLSNSAAAKAKPSKSVNVLGRQDEAEEVSAPP